MRKTPKRTKYTTESHFDYLLADMTHNTLHNPKYVDNQTLNLCFIVDHAIPKPWALTTSCWNLAVGICCHSIISEVQH